MGIIVQGLSHVYMAGTPFEKKALIDVDLTVEAGSFVAILGSTGSGKSTLIQHIAGLLRPTTGSLRVFDTTVDSNTKKLAPLRRHVGVAFQYPEHQLFEETVAKDIAYGPSNQGIVGEELAARVRQGMEWVGLTETFAERSPFHLSGGQMRRVAIAGVLAMEPEVLVLDEPTAGLDPKGQRELLEKIYKLHQERSMTVILVSHSMAEAARYADVIHVMHEGRRVLSGSPVEVFSQREKLVQWGLELPPAAMLGAFLRQRLGSSVPQDLLTVEALEKYLYDRWQGREDP
ncbi:energy-coupling factor transport system ATP-binding protein [Marininema mesophilum]|uniref:Energy-coupling factor transporter ATP-binding protein EcfA2 n=1 Tax=Marininema mesophilum TaxID=1048340 RepID=A0A1H2XFI8_9BACL|nr:energy-coupling factor transporter ATPase [Marininema mesophilum]SDW91551.1 energy-coupling factor transport system ATP-binding protein [Marininema mesophilum]